MNGYWDAHRNSLRNWESHGYALRNVDRYGNLLVLRHLHWSGYGDYDALRNVHVHRVGLWYLHWHLDRNLHGHWARNRPLNADRHRNGDVDGHRHRDILGHLDWNWYVHGNWKLNLVRTGDRNINHHRDWIIHHDVVRLVNSDRHFNTARNLNGHRNLSADRIGDIAYHLLNDIDVPRHLNLHGNLNGNLHRALHGNGIWHWHRNVNGDRHRYVNRDRHRHIDRYLHLNGVGAVHLHINGHRDRDIHRDGNRYLARHSDRNLDRDVNGHGHGHINGNGLGNLHGVLNRNRNIHRNCHLDRDLAIDLDLDWPVHLNLNGVIVRDRNPNIDRIGLGNLDGIWDVHRDIHRNIDRALNGVRVGNGHRNLASLHQDLGDDDACSHSSSCQLCLLEHIPPTTNALALAEKKGLTTIQRFRVAVVDPAGAQVRGHNTGEVKPVSANALASVGVKWCTVVCRPGKSIDKFTWAERSKGRPTYSLNTRLKTGKLSGGKSIERSPRRDDIQASNALARINKRTITIKRLRNAIDKAAGTKSRRLSHDLSPRLCKLARRKLGTGLSELPIVGLDTGLGELPIVGLGTRLGKLPVVRLRGAKGPGRKGRELGTRLIARLKLSQKRVNLGLSQASRTRGGCGESRTL